MAGHRDDQHRTGPVAGAVVEGAVETVGDILREMVHVVHHKRAATSRRVAGERSVIHGNGEALEPEVGAALGTAHPEGKAPCSAVILLHQIETGAVCPRHIECVRDDQVQQRVLIALGQQPNPDRGEVGDFAGAVIALGSGIAGLTPGRRLPERRPKRDEQPFRPDGRREISAQQGFGNTCRDVVCSRHAQHDRSGAVMHQPGNQLAVRLSSPRLIQHDHSGAAIQHRRRVVSESSDLYPLPCQRTGHRWIGPPVASTEEQIWVRCPGGVAGVRSCHAGPSLCSPLWASV